MEEERGDEKDGFGVGGALAVREEEKGEPECGAFHEKPCEWWRKVGTPTWAVVFAVWGLEEAEGDEGWWSHEVESEESVVEERLVGNHGGGNAAGLGLGGVCEIVMMMMMTKK